MYNHTAGRLSRWTRKLPHERKEGEAPPLDALNDSLPVGVTLHPTKGYRRRGVKGLLAAHTTAQLRQSYPLVLNLRAFLRAAKAGINTRNFI